MTLLNNSLAAWLICLSGCAVNAPSDPFPRPVNPTPLPVLRQAAPVPDFIGLMESFLSGSLPRLPGSGSSVTPASINTTPPAKP